jgi:hypothetical protein
MGTVTACPDYAIAAAQLKTGLSALSAVISVHTLTTENAFSVWVGINKDDAQVREAIYQFEDEIADRYADVLFDFHVIPVPAGRKVEDYISAANPIFQRHVA